MNYLAVTDFTSKVTDCQKLFDTSKDYYWLLKDDLKYMLNLGSKYKKPWNMTQNFILNKIQTIKILCLLIYNFKITLI